LERFDHDELRQLLADRQASVTDLADEISLAGEQSDDLVLTEAQLPQAVLHLGAGTESADTDRHAGFDPAQRAHFTTGFRPRFHGKVPAHIR
jgi:hypothetical protein